MISSFDKRASRDLGTIQAYPVVHRDLPEFNRDKIIEERSPVNQIDVKDKVYAKATL